MPIHRPDTVTREIESDPNDPCGPVTLLRYSDDGELSQFGATLEILPPGSSSSIKHWHSDEDEMVYMLKGEVTLHEGDTTTQFRAGEVATFRAGVAEGHCLENTSDADARYLVIGTRSARDIVTYPERDRVLTRDRTAGTSMWTTVSGAPADSAYRPKFRK